MGYGLVDPVDDFSQGNPASHPELLDDLAASFAEQGFDLKLLLQALVSTRVYQLSSRVTHDSQADPRRFARMPLRGLSAHQLNNCLQQVAGNTASSGSAELPDLVRLAGSDSSLPRDQQVSVLFALAAMNGAQTHQAASPLGNPLLAALCQFPLSNEERIDALYLALLSRFPSQEERERMLSHVTASTDRAAQEQALADVLWVLLNSSEFFVNH